MCSITFPLHLSSQIYPVTLLRDFTAAWEPRRQLIPSQPQQAKTLKCCLHIEALIERHYLIHKSQVNNFYSQYCVSTICKLLTFAWM